MIYLCLLCLTKKSKALDGNGLTAALLASREGHTECVRILAQTGRVDWNKGDKYGRTPLYWALRWGHSDVVFLLVQQPKIDYNVKTEDGETLAHVAVRGGGVKCVETLAAQEKCECWNVPDSAEDTPFLKALKRNKMDILQILLQCPRVDLNMKDDNGDSLIMVALKTDKIDLVMQLLQHPRVDLSCRDSQISLQKIARLDFQILDFYISIFIIYLFFQGEGTEGAPGPDSGHRGVEYIRISEHQDIDF